MASLRKNPRSGRWEVRYRSPDGVQRTDRIRRSHCSPHRPASVWARSPDLDSGFFLYWSSFPGFMRYRRADLVCSNGNPGRSDHRNPRRPVLYLFIKAKTRRIVVKLVRLPYN